MTGFRLARGARPDPAGGVRFSVWAPRARSLRLRTASAGETELEPREGGVFEAVVPGARIGDDYVYHLPGVGDRPDPVSRHQPAGVHGPSRVVDPDAFAWSDGAWRGVERPDLVVYELHVGTFTEKGTFEAVIEQLPALQALGVTAIELMPIAQFPGARNWGYDGVLPYAPQASYGGPAGLRRLVDAAHGEGLAVLLDVVYNHLGPEGNVLADFGPYFTDRYRTPWGEALNFDGEHSDEVRRYFVDNALYWIAEFHLDGLRLDAVHAIHDESARPFLAELADAVRELGAGLSRHVHVIAESDANDPRLVRPPERGGLGLDAVWSDDFHHAVHAELTGERGGYYEDFGGVERVARAFSRRFVYAGDLSRHRARRHGAPADDVPSDRFVVCVQNHDQVGNRARGERLAALLPPEALRVAAALLLLSPYLPLLFMGEEYGEPAPFLYFVSHEDPDLLEAVRRGRRAEFAAFDWTEPPPDPGDEATFAASRLDRSRGETPEGAGLLALHRALLRVRREEPSLRPGAAEVHVACHASGAAFLARCAAPGARPVLAAFHLGTSGAPPASLRVPGEGAPWRLRLATRDPAFGGDGALPPAEVADTLPLPPASAALYTGCA